MPENTDAQVKLFQPTQHLLESCTLAMHVAVVVNLRFFSEVWEQTFNNCVASCRGSEWIGDHMLVGGDTCESIQ